MELKPNNMPNEISLIGTKFNRLTVIKKVGIHKRYRTYLYECKCDCGVVKTFVGSRVKSGSVKSCGCLQKQRARENVKTHGMSGTRFFKTWLSMIDRCKGLNNKLYINYGGRGITVCERWLKFINFRDDMYESYKDHVKVFGTRNTTIERIDNCGNYEISNCRWASYKEQSRNKRSNVLLEYKNKTQILADWAREVGLTAGCLRMRLKQGCTVEQALTLPHWYKLTKSK
jgi:hypothetical protein